MVLSSNNNLSNKTCDAYLASSSAIVALQN